MPAASNTPWAPADLQQGVGAARLALGFLDYKRPTAVQRLRISGAIFDAFWVQVRELPITPLDKEGDRQCK
ncbi:MAG: hypothetical protein ACYDHB_11755 [Candidatus Dormibacteria bacterium]